MAGEVIVDTPTEVGPLTLEDGNLSSEPNNTASEPGADAVIPDKFKGKSLEEVITSYSELEKLNGRQGQELGQLRQMADTLIQERSTPVTPALAPDAETKTPDLYEDPDAFVAARVKEAIKPLEQRLKDSDRLNTARQLKEVHPDYMEVAVAPEFLEWVQTDAYRRRQYVEANNNHDFEAANNLFSTFKATQTQAEAVKRDEKKQELKDASTVTGSIGKTSKKIYNRAALVNLQIRDPDKYEALQPEILQAYAEGRVR